MSAATKLLKGLVSKTDEALNAIKREKGTGAEFLRELEKTPGVKPAEIKDRRLDKVLPAMGKTTKADVQRVLKENPPPKVEESVLGESEVNVRWFSPKSAEAAGLDKSGYAIVNRRGKVIEGPFDSLYQAERAAEHPAYVISPAKYAEYQIPGGQNYREILLRLPPKGTTEAEARAIVGDGVWNRMTPEQRREFMSYPTDAAKREPYRSSHWSEPNVLAHARVSDRVGPNGEKILHIEEIQSDWHQAGRKQGYRTPEKQAEIDALQKAKTKAKSELKEIERRYNDAKEASKSFDAKIASPEFASLPAERQAQMREAAKSWGKSWMDALPELMKAREVYESIPDAARVAGDTVPDAPFKKNWHELTMKRLLNYAAENNYDRIAITPGMEQAKRYDLSQHIDSLNFSKNPQGTVDIAASRGDSVVIDKTMQTPQQLENLVGKELARKILDAPSNDGSLSGLDLQVGGEGMKGFYDKILPDYLNSLGKPYGASVGRMEIPRPPANSMDVSGFPLGEEYIQGRASWSEFLAANPDAASKFSTPLHSFDITPQMRQEITSKGLPLYSAAPVAATGVGAAALADDQQEKAPVYISDNPDTMRLELEDKQMAAGGVAKLAKLARAGAKSKQEIEAIAERMAPQVLGEFVRKPGKTESIADKSRKQFEREKKLPIELRIDKPERTVTPVDVEKLQGQVVIGIPGDPTITGKSLKSVGDVELESAAPQHGGPLYGLYHDKDHFWASGLVPARRVQNLAKEASEQYDAPVIGKYMMMGPESSNYAQHFADANLQAIDLSKMTKEQIEAFNALIRKGSPESGPRPSFPGIEDKGAAYLHMAVDPEIRKHFNALMQQPKTTEALNLPSGLDIRYAITEPGLRNLETGASGYSLGRMRLGQELSLSEHPTYSHDIPGEFVGGLKYPVPYELSFPDSMKLIRGNPRQAMQEFGSLKGLGARQIIDQQMIDELKMYEEAMKKRTGKKAGGKVKGKA